jgi:hypothetical protein
MMAGSYYRRDYKFWSGTIHDAAVISEKKPDDRRLVLSDLSGSRISNTAFIVQVYHMGTTRKRC